MTFLPIIERELRVRARGRTAYWTRFAVALVGLVICLPPLVWSGPFGTPGTMDRSLFNGFVSAAFLLSCGACLLTADLISSERREGTLGLLLLTRVTTFDVLLGKLSSAGLTSLCALVACLPMMMIPILAGGVTGGEVVRKGLVLVATLLLALAAGVWASVRGQERLKTARTALLLVTIILLGPGLFELTAGRAWAAGPTVGLLSPLGTLVSAGDAAFKASRGQYWTSLILVQAMAWALVASAGFRLRRAWREEGGEETVPALAPSGGGAAKPDGPWLSCSWTPPAPGRAAADETELARFPSQPLEDHANPIAWLLQRQRGTQVILWAAALVVPHYLLYWVVFTVLRPSSLVRSSAFMSVMWPLGLLLAAVGSALIAWAASRYFVAARGTGELELLLTTPLGAKEMVATQWAVLKRRLRWPMLFMVAPAAVQAGVALLSIRGLGPPNSVRLPSAMSSLLSCVGIFLEVGALCWVGLWFGLKAGGQARAIVWTVTLVKGLPTLLAILCSFALNALVRPWAGSGAMLLWIMMCLPAFADLVFYLWLIKVARQRLLGELGAAEPIRFDFLAAAHDALAGLRRARHWTPS
jgi:hypothetical protein